MTIRLTRQEKIDRNREVYQAFKERYMGIDLNPPSRMVALRLLEYCIQSAITRNELAIAMAETKLCKRAAVENFLRWAEGDYYPYNPSIQVVASFVLAFERVSGDRSIVSEYRSALLKDLGLTRAIDIDEGILRD